MGMYIYPAGRDHRAIGIDDSVAMETRANRTNHAVVNRDVSGSGRSTGAVYDLAALDN